MKQLKNTFLLFASIVIVAALIETCGFPKPPDKPEVVNIETTEADNFILENWKQEKEFLQMQYEAKISSLETVNDSLSKVVVDNKKTFAAYRFKTHHLKQEVQNWLTIADSLQTLPDSLMQLTDALFVAQAESDSACLETVYSLESVIEHKDSMLIVNRKIIDNLRDLNREEVLRVIHLSERLNISLKEQKKKTRNNRFLTGGIVFISGLASSVFIAQQLK